MVVARFTSMLLGLSVAALIACGSIRDAKESTTGADGSSDASDDHALCCDWGIDASAGDECPRPLTPDDIAPWAPATQQIGACSQADIDTLAQNLITEPPFADIYNAISTQACKDCVISTYNADHWQPLVLLPQFSSPLDGSADAFFNYAPCYQLAAGGTTACAKGESDNRFCTEGACSNCGVPNDCVAQVSTTECAAETNAIATHCTAVLASYATACTNQRAILNLVCGDGTIAPDPGTGDASSD